MKRKTKLKIEITCEVGPDGSLGMAITSSSGHRSGYCLNNPFEPNFTLARQMIAATFRKVGEPRSEETKAT